MSPIVRILKLLLSILHHPHPKPLTRRTTRNWWCKHVDLWCWSVGYICTTWWFLLFVYNSMVSSGVELVGDRLRREGLRAEHPVVVVGGGELEVWQGKSCAEALFRQRLWGGGFGDIYRRPQCWMEHMSLERETGLDPPGIRVRHVSGLVANNYFMGLIENLARIGYEGKNVYMAAYDWRLSFHNTEVRDQSLSRLKSTIELMVRTHGGKKVVIVPYSMGALYFLHFLKWVEAYPPMGGGCGRDWCSKHIKAIMNIEPQFLGAPQAMSGILSDEAKAISSAIRAMSPGVLDTNALGFQTLKQIMRVSQTWDSVHYLLPKGGKALLGVSDQSVWTSSDFDKRMKKTETLSSLRSQPEESNGSDGKEGIRTRNIARYRSLLSLLNIASWTSLVFSTAETKHKLSTESSSYYPMESSVIQVKPVPDAKDDTSIKIIVEKKLPVSKTVHDLLQFITPKLTQRATSHFSDGLADDLDDLKYSHYKYWSNPLETKLPDAPDTEIYCLYGVDNRLHVNDDENYALLSAGFMCAKGWYGQTRFNPSGMRTYVREYIKNSQDIMRSDALIEDIIRVASGDRIGGDRIYSGIRNISNLVKIWLVA